MIYLASPYSSPEQSVRLARFEAACRAAAYLMRKGEQVFSPIAHTHPIAKYDLPLGWDYWQQFDHWYIERCERVMVLLLKGWEASKGVEAEIGLARRLNKPVSYLKIVGNGYQEEN